MKSPKDEVKVKSNKPSKKLKRHDVVSIGCILQTDPEINHKITVICEEGHEFFLISSGSVVKSGLMSGRTGSGELEVSESSSRAWRSV